MEIQMARLFNTVSIIGIGLIGSSIARALQKHEVCHQIVIYDNNVNNRVKAFRLGLGSLITHNLPVAVVDTDLIIICTPISAYEELFREMLPLMEKDEHGLKPIITDVGSVMGEGMKIREQFSDYFFDFVPGHPIAGTENSGPDAGFAELFENRWTILNDSMSSPGGYKKVKQMWSMFGSNVEVMTPFHHDMILALTSHLPHLIAFSVVKTAMSTTPGSFEEISKYSAGGFRDFTRIAASDPVMWRDIFLNNKDALLTMTHNFKEILTMIETWVKTNDSESLVNLISETREVRRSIIKAQQS